MLSQLSHLQLPKSRTSNDFELECGLWRTLPLTTRLTCAKPSKIDTQLSASTLNL